MKSKIDNSQPPKSSTQGAMTYIEQSHATELCTRLEDRYGPLLSGKALAEVLGHRSVASLRQARLRGHIPIALFTLPKRRGYFALTGDVAEWLARARATRG